MVSESNSSGWSWRGCRAPASSPSIWGWGRASPESGGAWDGRHRPGRQQSAAQAKSFAKTPASSWVFLSPCYVTWLWVPLSAMSTNTTLRRERWPCVKLQCVFSDRKFVFFLYSDQNDFAWQVSWLPMDLTPIKKGLWKMQADQCNNLQANAVVRGVN
jgi:hypothetical protein